MADVVGSRTITVTAADSSGTTSAATFTFGKGPLSVFSKIDGSRSYHWAEKHLDIASNLSYDFQDPTNIFPAAGFCGGSVSNANAETDGSTTSGPGFYSTGDGWSDAYTQPGNRYKVRYAQGSKLPTTGQLMAVSGYYQNYNSGCMRKGAAMAAGWPNHYWYWAGDVLFFYDNYFYAAVVSLPKGFGGQNLVVHNGFMACLH